VAKVSAKKTEGPWEIRHGRVYEKSPLRRARSAPAKQMSAATLREYNNPYRHRIERVWFDGRVVFATEQGEVDVDPKKVKVAQEYQIVYAVKLTEADARERQREARPGSVQHLRLCAWDEEIQRDLAVQLRHRPARLRPEHPSLGARLPPQRLPDQTEHGLRDLTGSLARGRGRISCPSSCRRTRRTA
jgi:hypothetical protein